MAVLVYGFPNRIAALQFEHAWQHPYQTRHIPKEERISKSKTAGRTYPHKIGNLRLLMKSSFFNRMNLRVMFFNSEAYKVWCDNKFHILAKVDIMRIEYVQEKHECPDVNMLNVKEFKERIMDQEKTLMVKFKEVLQGDDLKCSICKEEIDYVKCSEFDLVSICYHSDCKNLSHLDCIRTHFQEEKEDEALALSNAKPKAFELPESSLIPTKGKCPSCERNLIWSELVCHSTKIRFMLGFAGKQPEFIDGEADSLEKNEHDDDGNDDEDD